MMTKALSFSIASAMAFASLNVAVSGADFNAAYAKSAASSSVSQNRSQAQAQTDQSKARMEMRAGNVLSLRQIERRILPRMKGSEYLGPAYDSAARAYRLKFIKDGRVTYVDVDAKSGKIINRSK
ncbi:MAG: PepSY domain-containing protein [Erythrobacter sp.]